MLCLVHFLFFFFNDTATTEIYTLSLHDALPISVLEEDRVASLLQHPGNPSRPGAISLVEADEEIALAIRGVGHAGDRKSTRLNSSHANISYAVFCLKKKKMICLSYTSCLCIVSM